MKTLNSVGRHRIITCAIASAAALAVASYLCVRFVNADEIKPAKGGNAANQVTAITDDDLAKAAQATYKDCEGAYEIGYSTVADVHGWSLKWTVDEIAAHPGNRNQIAAYERHLANMHRLCESVKKSQPQSRFDRSQVEYYILEAKKLLGDAKRQEKEIKSDNR